MTSVVAAGVATGTACAVFTTSRRAAHPTAYADMARLRAMEEEHGAGARSGQPFWGGRQRSRGVWPLRTATGVMNSPVGLKG